MLMITTDILHKSKEHAMHLFSCQLDSCSVLKTEFDIFVPPLFVN